MAGLCQVQLACASDEEASSIIDALLEKRLIACGKKMPVSSAFHWKNSVENSEEVLVLMDSKTEYFEQINRVVSKIHSYETYVLQAIPIIEITKDAEDWLNAETKQRKEE